jgi:hypothetical protein
VWQQNTGPHGLSTGRVSYRRRLYQNVITRQAQ